MVTARALFKTLRFFKGLAVTLVLAGSVLPGTAGASAALWTSKCSGCHGVTPSNPQKNAAGNSTVVIDYAIANVGSMAGVSAIPDERLSIANYITTTLAALNTSTAFNTAKAVNVSSHITIPSVSFSSVAVTSVTNGTTSVSGTTITYTPTNGFVGTATITYRGVGSVTGPTRSYTVVVNAPPIPVISSLGTATGTYNSSFSYQITASNSPTSYSVTGTLPTGTSVNTNSGLISGTVTGAPGLYNVTVRATNAGGTGTKALAITINQASQSITFATPAGRAYSPTPFAVSPSASSGLTVALTSGSTGVCTVSGFNVTMVNVGTCILNANQPGNTNYAAAGQAQRSFSITQASQTVTFGAQTSPRAFGTNFAITTGTASSGLTVTYDSNTPATCSVSGTTVTPLAAGTCTIGANQAGDSRYVAATEVPQSVTISAIAPGAPTLNSATAGNTQTTLTFTAPSSTGGSAITSYNATCVPSGGGINSTGSATSSPITVTGMINTTTYSCSLTATNVAGTGSASNAINVTPTPTPVPPAFTSANNATFTVGSAGTFNVTASGTPAPTISSTGTRPSGVNFTNGTGTGVLAGTPALGTVGIYNLVMTANGTDPDPTQNFTLTVQKANQAIQFPTQNPSSFPFSTGGTFNLPTPGTVGSGLAVSHASTTGSVCSISGTQVAMLSVGTCTIQASQAGDADYNAATPVSRSFTITQGSQTISFPAQTLTTRPFSFATFQVTPTAIASSGLPVTYSSGSSSVCTVNGTTVTIVSVGTCILAANQAGNGNFAGAPEVTVNVTITKGDQAITFPAQGTQVFSAGGSFAISPVATTSSNLTIMYTSLTTDVCTVLGTQVTMLAVGVCTVAANQAGDGNWNAATQVTRGITINPAPPGAPVIGMATPGNGQALIAFEPPENNGGSAITSYTATCNPGGVTKAGANSPLTVTGLTNNVLYTCSVTATNAGGTSAPSGTVTVTPVALSGAQLWTNTCAQCHGSTPSDNRKNGAGSTSTVLEYVRANQPSMVENPDVQALAAADLAAIAQYIAGFVPPVNVGALPNTARSVSVASNLTLGSIAFESVEIVSSPTSGTLGPFSGTSATYTPANGFSGTVTFTYRGRRDTGGVMLGDARMGTIVVSASNPVLTVTVSGSGTASNEGIDCPGDCTEVYLAGEEITVAALPIGEALFAGWTGCDSFEEDPTCALTMNGSRSISLLFAGGSGPGPTVPRPDLDGNSRTDLLWHSSDGSNAAWLMDGTSVTGTSLFFGPGSGWNFARAADLDGNGTTDILWRHTDGALAAWLMSGVTPTTTTLMLGTGSGWSVPVAADLNGDGKSDVVLRHDDGSLAIWLMDGTTVTGAALMLGAGSGWTVTHAADFNADGRKDLVLKHDDGSLALWLMDGTSVIESALLFGPGSGWSITATGDTNGDGFADLVLGHTDGSAALWQMNGSAVLSTALLFGGGSGWSVSLTGDFNADGRSDLVWKHTDGSSAIWLMNGTSVISTALLFGTGSTWRVTHIADFNGDGFSDLVWRNTDGSSAIWLLNGLSVTGTALLFGPGSPWSVALGS